MFSHTNLYLSYFKRITINLNVKVNTISNTLRTIHNIPKRSFDTERSFYDVEGKCKVDDKLLCVVPIVTIVKHCHGIIIIISKF